MEGLTRALAVELAPTGRIGIPADIAQSYVYLMKQEYGSGQILTVDGGGVLI